MLLQNIPTTESHVEPIRFLVHLLLAVVLGQILGWHFVRYAQVLANKRKLARVMVYICATTMMIITVIKSSWVLSLGLVGALSIIRFRTPVKEPEELAYLFLAIAIGLGIGAEQYWVTGTLFVGILAYMAMRDGMKSSLPPLRTVLQVVAPTGDSGGAGGADQLRSLVPAVESVCSKVDLRRVDCHGGEFHASLLVEVESADGVARILTNVQDALPGSTVSVVERDGLD